jgi:mannose-6-phosphate isomerase
MPAEASPPLALSPLPVARPWGGRRARELAGLAPPSEFGRKPIGEWWLASGRASEPSIVRGGPHDGASLVEVLGRSPERVLGRRHATEWSRRFPLLLKLLDTSAPLSIQVHPSDADVPSEGKHESWYFLAAEPDAGVWLGLAEGRTPAEVLELARRGESPEALLVRHDAREGEVVHLPPGTIHALGAGILALEFQTSSDTTYRIWDWGRKPKRELHLDEALRVARAEERPQPVSPRPRRALAPPRDELVGCERYSVERLSIDAPAHFATDGERFEILLALGAGLRVAGAQGAAEAPRSHAVLVPAETEDYVVTPDSATHLFRFVPRAPVAGEAR